MDKVKGAEMKGKKGKKCKDCFTCNQLVMIETKTGYAYTCGLKKKEVLK